MTKPGQRKRKWHLIPLDAVGIVVDVLQAGAETHDAFGWKTLPNAREDYADALMRHMERYFSGERIDPDDGLPTMAHVVANGLIVLWHESREARATIKDLMDLDARAP